MICQGSLGYFVEGHNPYRGKEGIARAAVVGEIPSMVNDDEMHVFGGEMKVTQWIPLTANPIAVTVVITSSHVTVGATIYGGDGPQAVDVGASIEESTRGTSTLKEK